MALDPKHKERERSLRPKACVAIVVSRFHDDLTGPMLESARRELIASGVQEKNILVVWVPGSFEIPIVARTLAQRGDVDSIVCLGLILKGETEHDRYVAQGTVQGIVQVSQEMETPIHFGVLTCATLEQARARALPPELGGHKDKGREVARAAIETLIALEEAEEI